MIKQPERTLAAASFGKKFDEDNIIRLEGAYSRAEPPNGTVPLSGYD